MLQGEPDLHSVFKVVTTVEYHLPTELVHSLKSYLTKLETDPMHISAILQGIINGVMGIAPTVVETSGFTDDNTKDKH